MEVKAKDIHSVGFLWCKLDFAGKSKSIANIIKPYKFRGSQEPYRLKVLKFQLLFTSWAFR